MAHERDANAWCDVHLQRIEDLERRVGKVEDVQNEKWDALNNSIGELREKLANLNGRVAGYLLAAGLLGAVVAVIAQLAITHVQTDKLTNRQDTQDFRP